MIGSLVRNIGRRLGYEIIPSWRVDDLALASHLRQLFATLDVRIVLDVGANVGQYRDFLRKQVEFEGHIVSFEPIAAMADQILRRASEDSRWRVFQWALGANDGSQTINVTRSSDFSSFLNPESSLPPRHQRLNVVDRREVVTVKRLDGAFDTIINDLSSDGSVFLKMDTQGYDLEVVRGASGVLNRIAALQSEISIIPIYSGMPDYVASLKSLTDIGFDVTGMFPVSTDDLLRVIEFDCVMVNRHHHASSGVAGAPSAT